METPTKPRRNRRWHWIVGAIVAIVLLIVIIAVVSSSGGSTTTQAIAVGQVDATDLYAEYQANAIAAGERYEEKRWLISGVVTNIGRDLAGTPYVVLGASVLPTVGVQCLFHDRENELLAQLSVGNTIRVEGEVDGFLISVIVRDCQLR